MEADTEDTMREKAKGIERARAESKAKERAKDVMRKQVWKAKSLFLRNYKNS